MLFLNNFFKTKIKMKDFMMIFIGASYSEAGLSPEEMQAQMGKWWAWQAEMEKDGILKGGNALHNDVRRVSGAGRTVTDINATEVKELVGGYYIVSAKDRDEVVRIAQGYPDYDLGGTVEIREVMVFDQ